MHKINLSVIVTCHDLEKYLPDCIESLNAQTLPATEIIIIHDACKEPQAHANATTVIRETHCGVARSRHEGFLLSTGDYLLFLDADDILAEHYLEAMVQVALAKDADIVYPDVLLWSRWADSKFPNKWHETPKQISAKKMYERCEIIISSMMKRQVYEAIGGFENLLMFEDWLFWLKAMTHNFTFAKAPTYLKYRQRTNGRNRQADEIKNQVWNQVRDRFRINKFHIEEVKCASKP